MSASTRDKALKAIAQDRVRVVKATQQGIALDVLSSKPDPGTLTQATYRTLLYMDGGRLTRSCDCPASMGRCYHLTAAELIWRPGQTEGSAR